MPTARHNYAPYLKLDPMSAIGCIGPYALDDAPVDLKKSVKRRTKPMYYRYSHCHINFECEFDADMDIVSILAVSYEAANRDEHGYPVRMFSDYDLQESIGNMEMERAQDPQVLQEMRQSARKQRAEDEREVA